MSHFQEALSRAQRSSNLRVFGYKKSHFDLVAASGLAERQHRLGALAHRALESPRFAAQLFEMASKAIIGRARARHWHIKRREDLHKFSVCVGGYWLRPYCTTCDGRGVVVVGQVARDLCHTCGGSGQRALPKPADAGLEGIVDDTRFDDYVRQALECLDSHIASYLRSTRRALA